MSYHNLVNSITKEVMSLLNNDSGNTSSGSGYNQINISGKSISLVIPNIDINLNPIINLLKEFATKNTVKVFLPKWARSFQSSSDFTQIGAQVTNIDYANVSNSNLITGNIFIVPVNNDNFLRKLAKLEKSNAIIASLINALAVRSEVYIIPSGDYKISVNLKADLEKIKLKVVDIIDLQKTFLSPVLKSEPKTIYVPEAPKSVSHSTPVSSESNCYTCTTHDCISRCLSKVDSIFKAGADRVGATLGTKDIPVNLASFIDHTLLKPESTEEQVKKLCEEARQYNFASVCINPGFVPLAARLLQGSPVKVCTVIGFPLGATTTETKVFETKQAIQNGAHEIDMVINVGALKSKDYITVERDIREVVKACNGKLLKVIFETALLNQEEKIKACELSVKAGADFVKTSTGFGPGGATEEDIELMRKMVGPDLGVKASGSIRDTMTTLKMLKAGATRIGASASIAIVNNAAPEKDKKSNY